MGVPGGEAAALAGGAAGAPEASGPRRYPTLDLLRLAAIGMTLVAHASNLRGNVPVLRNLYWGFWLGVDLFMLISGWLLGGQLLREARRGPIDARRFYLKRWFRTLPPYFAMLLVLYFALGTQFSGPLPWTDVLSHAAFLQEYRGRNLFMVSWSLCVEEHFYLLLPLLIWAMAKRPGGSTVAWVVVATEVVSLVGRWVAYPTAAPIPPQVTHLRWHGLFVGMALAWISIHRAELWARMGRFATWAAPAGVVATCAVMASIGPPPNRWMFVGAPTVGTWALALLFFSCVHERSPFSRVSFPGLKYLGELTYAIYLTHDVLPRPLVQLVGATASVVGVLWRLGVVLAASMVLHHLVERPALRLRDRLLSRPRRPAADGVPASA